MEEKKKLSCNRPAHLTARLSSDCSQRLIIVNPVSSRIILFVLQEQYILECTSCITTLYFDSRYLQCADLTMAC